MAKVTAAKIVPHLWFPEKAAQAAAFYASVFARPERAEPALVRAGAAGGLPRGRLGPDRRRSRAAGPRRHRGGAPGRGRGRRRPRPAGDDRARPPGALHARERGGAVALVPPRLRGGVPRGLHRLAWRDDAAIFDAIEEAVRRARHSVHVDVYIWKPGEAGKRLADLVRRRAREGIAVRILVDPMGSTGFHEALYLPLRHAGCEVRYFRPFRKRPLTLTGRNHRKLVIVDGRVGFTGGFGIAPEWSGEGAWRDANVEAEGPVVRQMQSAFATHWLETGGAFLPREELERAAPAGDARAAYVTSTDVVGLSHARWVTHIALVAARRRAWIANAYFVPPPEVVGALELLPPRGVDVRLLLPGPHLDHAIVRLLQRTHYRRLGRDGVRIWEYQPGMMHAKTMLVDDRLVVVGSINLDYLSLELLEEGCLVADDAAFAAALERRWAEDLGRSRQVAGPALRGAARPEALAARRTEAASLR